jgi:tetratricopeptide (TPR) repeat protein
MSTAAADFADVARKLTAENRLEEALAVIRAGIRAEGGRDVNRLPPAADILARLGRGHEAIEVWRRVAAATPAHAGVWLALTRALMGVERLADAEVAVARTVRADPSLADAWRETARLKEALRVWDAADDALSAAARLEGDRTAGTWRRIGAARRNANRDAAAVAAFSRAVAGDGDAETVADSLHQLGMLARAAGWLDAAESAFDRALSLRPILSPTHFHRGVVRLLRGGTVERAFEGGRQLADAHAEYARRLLAEGKRKEACGHLHEALLFQPQDETLRRTLFDVLDQRRAACRYREMPDKDHTDEWGNIALYAGMEKYNRALVGDPTLAGVPPTALERANPPRPKIFDCFTFYNELDLLELRLRELGEVVDAFVVVEAPWTFQGAAKNLILQENIRRFAPWADKIIHVVVPEAEAGPSPWDREGAQRDAVMLGLAGRAAPDDVVFIGDVDEFPRRRMVETIRDNPVIAGRLNRLSADYYCGFINFKCNYRWHKQISLPYRLLEAMGPDHARFMAIAKYGELLYDAGWHFSWLGGIEKVVGKLKSYAHSEYTGLAAQDSATIMAALTSGKGIFSLMDGSHGYAGEFRVVPVDDSFPETIKSDPAKAARTGWLYQNAAE